MLLQSVLERGRRSVVEGGIEAELIDQVAHLLVGARHADHGQAQSLRQLRRDHANRARRCGDDDGLARLGFCDLSDPCISGQAGRDGRAEIVDRTTGETPYVGMKVPGLVAGNWERVTAGSYKPKRWYGSIER